MAHLPVIANVYRVTILWGGANNVTPRNVLHVQDVAGTSNEAQVGDAVGAATATHQFQAVSNLYHFAQVSVIKLDGSSASVIRSFGATGGEDTGDPIPQLACIIKLHTGLRGQANRGRLYLGPIGEGAQAGGVIGTTQLTNMTTAWASFWANLASGTPALKLGVASYKHAVFHELDIAPAPELLAGTQRRRMQQIRRA